jgi:NAD(P)-dependent dehydrogenase (short-subunit alcohol dehydrogenase family)
MDPLLTGKTAVVTGASRGIGAAIAKALAARGARIALLGRNLAPLQTLADSLPGALCVEADVSDETSVAAAFKTIRAQLSVIDVLVNNAGQAASAPFVKTGMDAWNTMLGVNLTGTYLCSREALPGMLERGTGRIVNIASTAGLKGYAYVAAYCAAKHGVIGLTRALALETAKSGVTVNAVCPGYTETDIVAGAVANIVKKTGKSESEARAILTAGNPQGRMVQPNEVANAVLWLVLPGSESITGQSIAVAGGEVM